MVIKKNKETGFELMSKLNKYLSKKITEVNKSDRKRIINDALFFDISFQDCLELSQYTQDRVDEMIAEKELEMEKNLLIIDRYRSGKKVADDSKQDN